MPFLGDIGTGRNQTHAFDPDIITCYLWRYVPIFVRKNRYIALNCYTHSLTEHNSGHGEETRVLLLK